MGQYLYLVMGSMCPYLLCKRKELHGMLTFSQADISYTEKGFSLVRSDTLSCSSIFCVYN